MMEYALIFSAAFVGSLIGSLISAGVLLRKLDEILNPVQGNPGELMGEVMEGLTEQGE